VSRISGARAIALALVIAAGLAIRALTPGETIPFFVWKYLGSTLWATAVCLAVAILTPRASTTTHVGVAATIALAVEFSRPIDWPPLDAFRMTLAGKLLLGRVFSLWNLVAYAAGIAFGAAVDRTLTRRAATRA
jgi:hypothetical protein